jgi:hypothetical protein
MRDQQIWISSPPVSARGNKLKHEKSLNFQTNKIQAMYFFLLTTPDYNSTYTTKTPKATRRI